LQKATAGCRANERLQQQIEQHRAKLEAYEPLCQGMGEGPADVALAWLLRNPVVTAPIIGLRTPEQLIGTLRALEISLADEMMARLEALWALLPVDQLTVVGTLVFAGITLALAVLRVVPLLLVCTLAGGMAWLVMMSCLTVAAQTAAPGRCGRGAASRGARSPSASATAPLSSAPRWLCWWDWQ
jgi:hypothetical protein